MLPASSGCGATIIAMMGRIVSKQREVVNRWSVGQLEGLALHLLAKPGCGLSKRGLITQHRIADACHLVGERAGALIVVGARLQLERPVAQAAKFDAFGFGDFGG